MSKNIQAVYYYIVNNKTYKYKIMKYITAKSASLSCTVQISYQSLEQLIKLKQHLEKYYLNFF